MKIKLDVKFTDGTEKIVEARFPDFVAFERTWNRSVTRFETELRLTDLAWMCWHSEKRTMATTKPFEPDWLNDIDTLAIHEDEEAEVLVDGDSPLGEIPPTGV